MQTRLMSLVETMTNITVGLVISFLSQIVIFKIYNVSLSTQQNVEITLYFTIISILRSYALRRFFNSIRRTT